MSKIRRNEACPCGSGKKYKRCCGAFAPTNVRMHTIEAQLDELHRDFIEFAIKNYEKHIQQKLQQFKTIQDKDLSSVYHTGLMIWLLLNVHIFHNQTVFSLFSKQIGKNYYPLAKKIFEKWQYQTPFVYEVIKMNRKNRRLKVRALLTGETYVVPFNEKEEFHEGRLIVGTIVPYGSLHNFFFQIIKLHDLDKEEVLPLITKYADGDRFGQNTPDFLYELFRLGVEEEIDESTTLRKKVTQLFTDRMEKQGIDEEVISKGISIWNHYYHKENPANTKTESLTAALEYYVQKSYLNNSKLTQSQLAKEYCISPSSVSTNYRKLKNAVNEYYIYPS